MTVSSAPIGFIGLGSMGEPMALNLAKAGTPLLVWNRTPAKAELLAAVGAEVAATSDDVFERCTIIILMLATEAVMDAVLARGTERFAKLVAGRVLVSMATVPPDYSKALDAEIRAAGGTYVEAPVSGSRKPAEAGQLVAMLAGDAAPLAAITPLLAPMCRHTFVCGAVPSALMMKLAVNLFLITTVTGLAEAAHFADRQGLDLNLFMSVINTGQMASDISRVKIAKLVGRDFTRQAAITDVLKNNRFVVEAARRAGVASPLIDACYALYDEAQALGYGDEDMAAVVRALEHLTAQASQHD